MTHYVDSIEKRTLENIYFRKVLFTATHAQLVVMCLQPGEDIGLETHAKTDQVFYVVKGQGRAVVGTDAQPIQKGSMVIAPAGTAHNLVNDSGESLRLFTLYVPPQHARGTVHATRADALAAETA